MSQAEFVACYSGIYELSSWVAEQTWSAGIGDAENTLDGLAQALARTVDASGEEQLMTLIRNHPDLAGKAAVAGKLTEESTSEQSSAGINQCSAEEFARFNTLNTQYKSKFEFPFIMAVRNSNRHAILKAFEERIHNDSASEFRRAIEEIHKIAGFRLAELF